MVSTLVLMVFAAFAAACCAAAVYNMFAEYEDDNNE